ncbi:hypothetical protein TSOC_014662, partial [Tetrabaena socialis]
QQSYSNGEACQQLRCLEVLQHLTARMARSGWLLVALVGLASLGAAVAQYPPPARGLPKWCAINNRTTGAWACNLAVGTPTACE